MKVLQIISNLGNGGAEKFVVELSNELSKNNEVILCTFKPVQDWMQFPKLLMDEVRLISLNKKKGFDIKIFRQLFKLIRAEKPNVVHFHLDSTVKYISPLVLLFPKISFVHTLHSDLNQKKIKIFSGFAKFNFLLKRIKLVCISENILSEFKNQFPSLKFYMVKNGVSELKATQKFQETKDEINLLKMNNETSVFLSVGRLDANKNQELLMRVFGQLKTYNIICLIIGNDPSVNKTYLNKLVEVKPENVFILGPKANVADYLICADAFVMSSLNEGLPISALEALSVAKPVLATPAGGLKSLIVNYVNGLLAKDFSEEEFGNMIIDFLKLDHLQLEKIATNNDQKFKNFYNISTCAKKYTSLY